jgi:hypothetical protein
MKNLLISCATACCIVFGAIGVNVATSVPAAASRDIYIKIPGLAELASVLRGLAAEHRGLGFPAPGHAPSSVAHAAHAKR